MTYGRKDGRHDMRTYVSTSRSEDGKRLHGLAAERRATKTFLIMETLAKAGYPVAGFDMVRDRGRKLGDVGT
jgi:hypothetical protein